VPSVPVPVPVPPVPVPPVPVPVVSVIIVSVPMPSEPIIVESESDVPSAFLFELHAAIVTTKHAEISDNLKAFLFIALVL
jgi:hypothetical protein